MIKNYFTLNRVLNLRKTIWLFFVFSLFSQVSNAQCAIPVAGCTGTNLSNFGADSNNDAATIEYDNFISSFHSTIVRTSDGSLQVWGEKMGNNGAENVLTPRTINRANYPALSEDAIPLKAALGSSSANSGQGILLATDGLYAWSTRGSVLDNSLTTSAVFQKLTIDGKANGLPAGVLPGDVKMMFATYKTLAITTCSGDVWVISQIQSVRGNGGTGNSTTWYKVTTSASGNPFLTNVVACRGNSEGLMALRTDGSIYVWGNNISLGDNSDIIASQSTAAQMTIPAVTPKMIGSTGTSTERSYYILAANNNLYALGENSDRQLGDWSTIDRKAWVQPRYLSATGPVMNNIKWISVQEHDTGYGAVNVINSNYNLYVFGENPYNLLGTTGNSTNPVMPTGFDGTEKILAVETGGHTSMIVKSCQDKFGYTGHRIRGSMGDGTTTDATESVYTFATANVQICGAESKPAIKPISTGGGPDSKYCIDDPVLLNPTPAGGTLSILSGPGTLSGNNMSFTGVGTVVVQYSVTTECGGPSVTTRNFEGAICSTDLQITKTADIAKPSVGNNIVFTLTAKNSGPYKATGVAVNDILPAGYTFVSAVPSTGTWSAPEWSIGSLTSGTSATLSITATVNETGPYANTAAISGNNPDSTPANNSATAAPVVETNLSVTKTVNNTTPNIGSNVTFTITASNAGTSKATGVKVTDNLPSGYTLVSAVPSIGTWSAPEWTIGELASGADANLIMVATVKATGSYANTASIAGTQNDPDSVNNEATVTPTVNQSPTADSATLAVIASSASATAISSLSASDTDGTIASYKVVTLPSNGTLSLNGTPVTAGQILTPAQAGELTYAPSGTYTGNDTFTFMALDNLNAVSNTATITIPVGNNAPTADSATLAVIPSSASATAISSLTASDTDGTIASYKVVTLPSNGTLSLNGTPVTAGQILTPAQAGELTYAPSGTYTGNDTFTFTALDDLNAVSNTATITIPVGNNAPTADSATLAVIPSSASATAISSLTASDTDGTIASYKVVTLPSNGTLSLNGTPVTAGQILTPAQAGELTYAPSGTYTGNDTFTFTALDDLNAVSNTATITIPVGNNAPTADSATLAVIPSSASATAISSLSASDTDGTIASYKVVTLPSNGTLSLNGTPVTAGQILTPAQAGELTYAPSGTYTGNDTFTFTALDDLNAVSNTATITIPVGNNAPTADSATLAVIPSSAGATAISSLSASDTDGTISSYKVVTLPSNGTLSLNGTPVTAGQILTPAQAGELTYAPSGTYTGNDTFTFTALDDLNAVSNTATITIPVGNNAPTADSATLAVIPSSASATAISSLSASDTDGTIASYKVVTLPSNGTLSLNGTPVTAGQILTPAQAGELTYAPSGTYTGNDTFTFTALDDLNAVSNTATITIPVGNNAPTADSATLAVIPSSAGATAISSLSASDTDGTISSYKVVILPANGTLSLNGTPVTAGQILTPAQAGELTYAPSGTYTGNDTFTFTALDNLNAVSNTATITIPVGNNAPTADSATLSVIPSSAGATAISSLTASDTDGTIASYKVVTLPANGTLSLNGTPVTAGQILTPAQAGELTYAPSGTYTGNDTFTFTALDDLNAVSNTATITIPVGNNAPTADSATLAVIPSSASATAISSLSASDTDGTIASYKVVTLPSNGTLSLNGTPVTAGQILTPAQAGELTYAPSGTYTGNDTFTFTALDDLNAVSNTATITIPVGNNAPTANSATLAVIPSSASATAISSLTASDTDGTIASYKVVTLPSNGTLSLNGTPVTAGQILTPAKAGELTYAPSGTYTGNDTFTFTALDDLNAVSNTATITIPVGNNAPTADSATLAVIPSSAGATGISSLTASDTDGTIASYTVVTLPANGTLSLNGTPVTAGQILTPAQAGELTYAPSGTYTGNDTFTFTALDDLNAVSNTATITIPVGNNAPTADSATLAVIPSSASATAISSLTASDTDGTIASYKVVTLPSNGTLSLNGTPVTAGQILTPAQAGELTYAPSGTYTGNDTFTFTALDDLNAVSNTATITIPVGNNAPTADSATLAVIPSSAGATGIQALTATDSDGTIVNYIVLTLPSHGILALNGTAVTAGQVLTPAQAGQLTYAPSGTFSGNDSFTFTATDNSGDVDAAPAVITIPVIKREINAVKDEITSVVGINEVVKVVNVLDNDTLDNNPLLISEVNLNVLTPDPNNVMTLKPDGTVELIPNAPAGTYTLTYEICEKANSGNCDTASVIVTVTAPTLTITAESYCADNTPYVSYSVTADNFTPTGLLTINWIDSADRVVATQTNMPLSGIVLWPGAVVDGSNHPVDWPGWVLAGGQWLEGTDGFELTRPAVTMQFTLNPTKSVIVNYPSVVTGCNARPQFGITAENDVNITADGVNGSLEVINVLDNDKLNGLPVNPEVVILTGQNFPAGITLNENGTIDVAPGTKGGDHTLTYQICEKANRNNCTTATVHIFVEIPSVSLIMKASFNDDNRNGFAEAGETITYTFTVKNTGNTPLKNVSIKDLLPGVVINGGPINLAVGESDTFTFTGTYTLTQADIIAGVVTNQAVVTGLTNSGIAASDTSDFENEDSDKPTVISLKGCDIEVFNAVSLNGDQKNERFYIRGIECYPDNTVQIFNRWGVLVFERDQYNNTDVVFKGFSEGRTTVKESNGLPEGTYYYILKYNNNQSQAQQKAGYLYLTR